MNDAFKNLFQTRKPALQGVTLNFNQATIQDFREGIRRSEAEGGKRKRYHFIHAIHSIYFAGDAILETILDLYESLEENGMLLISTITGTLGEEVQKRGFHEQECGFIGWMKSTLRNPTKVQ